MKSNEPTQPPTRHCLKAARLREEMSLRSVARRMQVPVSIVKAQEEGRLDLSVSDLYRWQRALRVPITELLNLPEPGLSETVRQRACMVRLVKTAKSLAKQCQEGQAGRLARRIVDEIHRVMPELEDVGAWPEGRPKGLSELGRTADVILTQEWFQVELE